ncbi:uncharacterized protein LOC124405911 [Diprion similis]|uniref:uncharacterized protein LOC124405911 n=1 Tax=Diprion similis TaxID=362088 RepID=UPI001EF7E33E|nr:uncharacterized protein LOC124405911 [Diprion similis]
MAKHSPAKKISAEDFFRVYSRLRGPRLFVGYTDGTSGVKIFYALLKQSRGTTGGGCNVNCDEFGWWLTGSSPGQPVDEDDDVPKSNCNGSPASTVCHEESEDDDSVDEREVGNDQLQPVHSSSPVEDPDGICLAEEPPCGTCSRSYTPERLIRNRDYRILTNSPPTSLSPKTGPSTPCKRYASKRNRRLSSLIDQQLVGASQLEAVLDHHVLDIKLPAAPGRRKGFAGRSPEGCKNASRSSRDLLAFANCESPPGILTPDLTSSGSSCEKLNCEWRRRSEADVSRIGRVEDSLAAPASVTPRKVSGRLVSTLQNFRSDENCYEDLPGHDVLSADSWEKGRVVHSFPEAPDDPESVVRQLQERINHIRDTNRDISEDLSSLRKNYEWAEQKTGNLTTATTKLRKEIRDLRYIDDLVNLLSGELKRISQRNWPFNLGHTEHHMEEINLVI